ncbi:MAG: hypothetical protein KKA67_14305 [Spirochaetes bacterium]|nr:hypothetical protein [Spirochaetota bacterium]MBU1081752.1 hypothetical protein [Spirochaetota bacterium]
MTPALIAIAVQVIVSALLIAWTRIKVRRFLGSEDEIDKIRREIGALIVELDASADRNVTVLEDRLTALKELLVEADRRISLLGQERARPRADGAGYDRLGRPAEPSRAAPAVAYGSGEELPPVPGVSVPAAQVSSAPASPGSSRAAPVPAAPAAPAEPGAGSAAYTEAPRSREPDVPFIRFSEKPVSIEEPFVDKVISLSRRGFSSDIIAARLGATMAEVDIVLSMENERDGRTEEH